MSAIEEVKNKFSKYIDGKPINGLKVDWKKINKDFKKMESDCKTPSGLYDPCMLPFDSVYWFTLMSERTSSKTTQLLLYAMMLYKDYGVKFCYVRRNKDNITKSMYTKLFEVINDKTYNYIGWLTNNQFNSVIVTTTKDVYYAVDGNPKETSAEPIGVLMDVEEYDRYCSAFNTTVHDFIIFDEPEAGIDLWSFNNLIEIFKDLKNKNNNKSIIISHQERIISIADKIVLLESGKIKQIGTQTPN